MITSVGPPCEALAIGTGVVFYPSAGGIRTPLRVVLATAVGAIAVC